VQTRTRGASRGGEPEKGGGEVQKQHHGNALRRSVRERLHFQGERKKGSLNGGGGKRKGMFVNIVTGRTVSQGGVLEKGGLQISDCSEVSV